jgi:alpha-L-fucosidase
MFIHYNPTTWTGSEYDDLSLPLERMNPTLLDTDQWCRVAQSWGARMILFVAKHTGGFCWWQTETSEYGVRNIPWRDGKGDVLADLSASCRKYGLDLGVYVYPGDESWGAGIGSGGRTKDPSEQEAFNQVFRQQLTEVLTRYGTMREVWFDGSCVIDVSDILEQYAGDAVIFQGPMASIRWVGNERGIAPDPNWYTLKKEDLQTGVATALHSDPDGDAYAPVEMDLPLLGNGGHKWFWAPGTDNLLLTVDQLMDTYYKSVGRGGVMLLNATPDTTGLIPESHVAVYRAFGEEVLRRFDRPLQSISDAGHTLVMDLKKPTMINHIIIREETALGQRVRRYVVEGFRSGKWERIREGTSVGTCKIDFFDTKKVRKIRLQILDSKGEPSIREFSVYHVEGVEHRQAVATGDQTITVGNWDAGTFSGEWTDLELDLTPYIDRIGQYQLTFQRISADYRVKDWGLEFRDWEIEMYGKALPEAIEKQDKNWSFTITRSQQTDKMDDFATVFRVKVRSKPGRTVGNIELKAIQFE